MSSPSKGRTQKTFAMGVMGLEAKRKMQRKDGAAHLLTDPDAVRSLLLSGMCPFCGRGPWKTVAAHASKMHGVGRKELRDMAGLAYSASITDPEVRAARSAATKKRGLPADFLKKSAESRARNGRTVSVAMQQASGTGNSASVAAKRKERETTIERWETSDRSWASLEAFAKETGRSVKTAQHYLKNICGLEVPDGRTESENRRTNYPPKRHDCDIDGCQREHVAGGLCRYHYRKKRISMGLVPACATPECDLPQVAQKLCSKHYAH